ncbi:MAG: plasmid stabilization protein [Methanocalculus sp. MSAO_Arc1]|nr:MAG: plasmid stabilization protein [Methanocalculus sp. MSAO_Arc1]
MYEIVFSDESRKYISKLSQKQRTHIKENVILCLGIYLHQNHKRCNKKLLKGSNPKIYRLHISMRHTLFYWIDDDAKQVKIFDAMGINQAHSKYKRL